MTLAVKPFARGLSTFLVGLVLSGVAALVLDHSNQITAQARIDELAGQSVAALVQRVSQYELGLLGARGAVVAAGVDKIDRKAFRAYSESRDYDHEFPGARGFGVVRRVAPGEEAAFVASARRDGWPSFAVRQLSPHNGERYLIQYVEPVARNREAVGLDIASENNRRKAAVLAMRTGKATLTGLITLVQATGKPKQSFLLLLPVYRPGMNLETEADRVRACIGWSYAPLVIDEVLDGLNLAGGELTLRLTDLGEVKPTAFFESTGFSRVETQPVHFQTAFSLFGRHWKAELSPTKSFYDHLNQTSPLVLACGLAALSALFGLLVYLMACAASRSREIHRVQAHRASIVEGSRDAIIEQSLDGEVIDWNPGAEKMFGIPAGDAVGQSLASLLLPPERRDEEARIRATICAGEDLEPFETTRLHRDGVLVQVSMAVSAMYNRAGQLQSISTVIHDISDAKQAQSLLVELNTQLETLVQERTRSLNETQHDFRMVLDALPSMVGYWDTNLINKVANKAYADWLGVHHSRIPGMHMEELLGKDIFQLNLPYVKAVLEGKTQAFNRTYPNSGTIENRHALVYYLPDVVEGEVKGFYVLVHDLTELKESRLQLAAAQRNSTALLEVVHRHSIVSVADRSGEIVEVNDAFCQISGFSREELIGENHRIINSGHHDAAFWEGMWATISAGQSWRADVCNKAHDGSLYWVDSIVAPIVGADGEVEKFISIRTDITERKRLQADVIRAHQLLETSERFLRDITDHLPVRISYTDRDAQFRFVNATFCNYLGLPREKIIGRTRAELFSEADLEGSMPFLDAVSRGAAQRIEHDEVVDNQLLSVDTHMVPDLDDDGAVKGLYMVSADVTERRKAERELRQTMALLRNVLAAASQVSIVAVKPDGKVSIFNAGAERLLGYSAEEVVDKMFSLDFHDRSEMQQRARELSASQGRKIHTGEVLIDPSLLNQSHEWTYLRKDGQAIPVSLGVTAMRDDRGELVGYLGIAHDVSQQREHERSLREAVHKARRASQAKTQFLANMSHEIRTPMNAVIGLSYLLERTELNLEQSGLLGKIKLASKSLLTLINDILDLSKIEAAELKIESAPFSPQGVLQELHELVSVQSDAKGIGFTVAMPPDLPAVVLGDATRLHQILLNLLTNAIKFTPAGSVQLEISCVSGTSEASRLRFAVRDSGIGMTEEHMSRLFTPFAQADASTTRRFGGSGLGLSIVKQLVELMGGKMGVTSEPERGSEFWVEMDFAHAAALQTTESFRVDAFPQGSGLAGVRVLVADDSEINLEVAQRVLELEGALVSLARHGQDAVDQLLARPDAFDVVLLDLQMPILDGFDACRRIRNGLNLQHLPIIALSASTLSSEMEHARHAGMNDFLTKPFDAAQLVARIRRWVDRQGSLLPMQQAEPAQVPPNLQWPTVAGIDTEAARGRLGGDLNLYCSMLKRLTSEFGDLGVSDPSPDVAALAPLAARLHKLQGSAGTLGALVVEQAARRADQACRAQDVKAAAVHLAQVGVAMAQLQQAVAPVLQAQALRESEARAGAVVTDEKVSEAELHAFIEALIHCDLSALDRLTALGPRLRGQLGAAMFTLLQQQADDLDFAGAVATLRTLEPATAE